jgi:hypothetical protein
MFEATKHMPIGRYYIAHVFFPLFGTIHPTLPIFGRALKRILE